MVFQDVRHSARDLEDQVITRLRESPTAIWLVDREESSRQKGEETPPQAQTKFEHPVAERISYLEQMNAALSQEIAKRREVEARLREENTALEERAVRLEASNKELERFSYTVSHDLRAPLRTMEGLSQALLEDCGSQLNVLARKYVVRVKETTQRMDDLIGAILHLARMSTTGINLQRMNLSEMGRLVVEECQKTDPSRRVDWFVMENITTKADPTLLRVVLDNLIGNAWKFTKRVPHPRIELGVTYPNAQPVFYVRDTGVGFDMAYAKNLFKVFQRLHAEKEFPGAGIGLATVHRIITRHGGKIWAEAECGHGATFYFTLEPQAEAV